MARCIQHEVDHLNGRLFIDRLSGADRKQAMRDLRELSSFGRESVSAIRTSLALIADDPGYWGRQIRSS